MKNFEYATNLHVQRMVAVNIIMQIIKFLLLKFHDLNMNSCNVVTSDQMDS